PSTTEIFWCRHGDVDHLDPSYVSGVCPANRDLGGRRNGRVLSNRVPRPPHCNLRRLHLSQHHITSNLLRLNIQHRNMSKNEKGNFEPVPKAQSQNLP